MMYVIQDNQLKPFDLGQSTHKCEALDRLMEEWNGYMEYREKAEKSNDKRYKAASNDEFRHALIALMDVMLAVKKHAVSDVEKAEFSSFWTELQSNMMQQ